MEYLFLILFIIIIIFLIISKFKLLLDNTNYLNNNNYIINDEYSYIIEKHSSINLNDLSNKSIYYNVIETSDIQDEKKIIELIINDINKTKINSNFKKINNIYIIIKKINHNINETFNIIIIYDSFTYNYNKIILIENDFSKQDLVYKLNMNDKLVNHYLQ